LTKEEWHEGPIFPCVAGLVLMICHTVQAQVAGSTLVGITVTEMQDVAVGWSVEREALNAPSSTHEARVRAVLQSLPHQDGNGALVF
jgi:hypothetical protein